VGDSARVDLEFDWGANPAGSDGSLTFGAAVSASLQLPGLSLGIDRLRASVVLGVAPGQGGLQLTATPSIQPPAGASAELDLPGFSGGGRLTHDGPEWRGALTARLGPVAVSGFGVLRTDEFSLLVLLAAEFTPPLQLSFGFTLVGVGGLVGINRRPDVTSLTEAASSGDLSRLLFPADPVADADRLLAALSSSFPPAAGELVIGPMLKLGWGTPTLVAATIAVITSGQGVVVIGRLAVTLPFEQAAIIRMEALILGTINADGLTVAASLTNSQLVGIPIEGDFRLRIRTGSDPLFALSAGGFHPAFTPPSGMAGMRRIGAEISPGPVLRARLGAYLAVTTNSVQFGASVELEAGFAGFGLSGHGDFDSILSFNPFGFLVDFGATVSIECADFDVCSITLAAHLSGPSPWRISGHASFSVLLWDVDVDLPELTWGAEEPPPLPPPRDPLAVLAVELGRPENWAAASRELPNLAQLRPGVDRDQTALHPMSQLAFSQDAVPLDVELQRMGGVPLTEPVTVSVTPPAGSTLQPTPAYFVPDQFRDLDALSQVTSAGYAVLDGGFTLDNQDPVVADGIQTRQDAPETYLLEAIHAVRLLGPVELSWFDVTGAGHAVAVAPAAVRLVRLQDPGAGVVAGRADLSDAATTFVDRLTSRALAAGASALAAGAATAAVTATHAGIAVQLLEQLRSLDPASAADLQIARAWEVAT
jgi:hypothetical protein